MAQDHQHLYKGRSGHLAVMAELLYRGHNVAIPEVDVGDDVFVVREDEVTVTRVQVKATDGHDQEGGYWAQFQVPVAQLEKVDVPALVYVFAVHYQEHWRDFLVIRRSALFNLRSQKEVGSPDGKGNLILRLAFTVDDVRNKGISFQEYRNAWDPWPPPQAAAPEAATEKPAKAEGTEATGEARE
jgi:hypothetical protein